MLPAVYRYTTIDKDENIVDIISLYKSQIYKSDCVIGIFQVLFI